MVLGTAEATTRGRRRAGLGVLKRTNNGQSSRADGGTMGSNALNRENGAVQNSVRSHHISHARCCVPQLWQCHQNSGSPEHRTPLPGGWDCPRALVLPVCRELLG